MGFKDFFKKLVKEEPVVEPVEKEKVSFENLEEWVEKKGKELDKKEQNILDSVQDQLTEYIKDLKAKVAILEEVDLDKRKDKDKIKIIVKENYVNYLSHVRRFVEALSELEENSIGEFISKTNSIFSDFDKRSFGSYQKANFLIGKEMVAVKESTLNLSKYFKNVFEENKQFIDSFKQLFAIKLKLNQIQGIWEIIQDSENKIKEIEDKIKKNKSKKQTLLQEIEEIKKTKDYLEHLKHQKEIELKENKINQDISELKNLIDFKELGNIFHTIEKKNEILKAHKQDFHTHFHKDNGEGILSLIEESGKNKEVLIMKINNIKGKKQELIEIKETIPKDLTKPLLVEISKIDLENDHIAKEKEIEQKSYDKNKLRHKEERGNIKKKLEELGVDLD